MKGWGNGVNMIRVLCGHDTMTALVVTLTHALFFFTIWNWPRLFVAYSNTTVHVWVSHYLRRRYRINGNGMKEGLSREVIEDHVSYQARPGG